MLIENSILNQLMYIFSKYLESCQNPVHFIKALVPLASLNFVLPMDVMVLVLSNAI